MKKLRNKETGEIGELQITEKHYAVVVGNGTANCNAKIYCSLTELNEKWEDYEEPKEDYLRVIESFINYVEEADDSFYCDESVKMFVEKLKAWERLKDKGFMFNNWDLDADYEDVNVLLSSDTYKGSKIYDFAEDLDLLFSQEDD